jgi:hypothetical protein
MATQMQTTAQGRPGPESYRTTARIVGALFLAGMVVYLTGNMLVQSILGTPDHLATILDNSRLLAIGALLMLLAGVWDAAHGILMFPVLKRHNERLAVGYLGARLIDAGLIVMGVIFTLLHIPLGRAYLNLGAADTAHLHTLSTVFTQAHLYAYEIGMLTVGFAGVMLCCTFYRTRLVPRLIAAWGLVGYVSLAGGSALGVLGFDLALLHTIPGGLWELFIGVWLLAKGFSSSPVLPARVTAATTPGVPSPDAVSATP